MILSPDIKFIKYNTAHHIERFTRDIRSSKDASLWRCLYSELDPKITLEASSKNIAVAYLKKSFEDADDVKVFWLSSGHLLIFFMGPVRAIIRDFEGFLDFISEGNRPDYHFFWEIREFWGYFDQILSGIIDDNDAPSISGKKDKRNKKDKKQTDHIEHIDSTNITDTPPPAIPDIHEALHRQRQMRYRPLLLIVEDDRVTRHFMQAMMEKYCDIAVVWNTERAKEFYKKNLPNIAFLDIELPDGDGTELAELLCEYDKDSFIVMVSSSISSDTIKKCNNAGVKGYVAKPATEKQLLGFINQYNKSKKEKASLG